MACTCTCTPHAMPGGEGPRSPWTRLHRRRAPVFAREEGRDCGMVNSGSSWTEGVRRRPRCDERWGGGCSGEQRLHYWFVFLTARLTCTYSHLMHLTHLTCTIQWLLVSPQSIASLSCQTCGGSSQLTYRVCVCARVCECARVPTCVCA